ncbi:hypothetical protein ABZ379_41475 [Streptomyces canus]|uniref:DUF7737 domain-containing protein n=1 Tax=Streptomyces canus TaxID=58343 RepID=UPI0033DA4C53
MSGSDLHRYKIHLGSITILIHPDGSYLCIVPARRGAALSGRQGVFLQFGDDRLSPSGKAFLPAADAEITDEPILTQMKRGACWPQ